MDTKIGSLDVCKPTCTDVGSLPIGAASAIQSSAPSTVINSCDATLGRHRARRLVQIGVTDVFTVPGDFNLTLLDHLIAEPGLTNIGCCNELNAGYAADGYARSRGVGACVVTFTVGGLSVLNAIAGANREVRICWRHCSNNNGCYGGLPSQTSNFPLPCFSAHGSVQRSKQAVRAATAVKLCKAVCNQAAATASSVKQRETAVKLCKAVCNQAAATASSVKQRETPVKLVQGCDGPEGSKAVQFVQWRCSAAVLWFSTLSVRLHPYANSSSIVQIYIKKKTIKKERVESPF